MTNQLKKFVEGVLISILPISNTKRWELFMCAFSKIAGRCRLDDLAAFGVVCRVEFVRQNGTRLRGPFSVVQNQNTPFGCGNSGTAHLMSSVNRGMF